MSVLENIKEANIGKTMLLTMPNGKSGNVKLVRFNKSDVMFENLSEVFESLENKYHFAPELCKGTESCFWFPINLMVNVCKLELV